MAEKKLVVKLQPKEGQKTIAEELNFYREKFPNGFVYWQQTHYQFIELIEQCRAMVNMPEKIKDIHLRQGPAGFWKLAEKLTDEFEKKYTNFEFEYDEDFFYQVEEKFNEWLNS